MPEPQPSIPLNRRIFLGSLSQGLGGVALASLLAGDQAGAASPRLPHLRPRAKSVIWIFLRGGLSHLESFDPKPALNRYAGLTIAESPFRHVQSSEKLGRVRVVVVNDANGQQRNVLFPLQTGFRARGQSGIQISDWFPHIGARADELAVIRSMWTTDDNHGAQVQFHSGRHMLDGHHPTIGAWITWGLGSLNDNLPQFISIGPRFFDSRDAHYLGPACDAVKLEIDPSNPLPYARPEKDLSPPQQQAVFDLAHRLNTHNAIAYPDDPALAARIQSYQLAFRMQTAVPDVLRLSEEPGHIRRLYGLDAEPTQAFGSQLLAARRLVERGVRFVQIMHGDGAAGAWDAHSGLRANHALLAGQVDLPTAGLLQDLRQRGLFSDTLVVFATEFGRTPGSQNGDGRDHHPYGFSVWLAGGGVRGGTVEGSTDEIGFHAVSHPHYVTDIHATLLHQLGLDHRLMEIPGRKRLEMDFGEVIRPILS